MIKSLFLFGFPLMRTNIDKTSYDKKSLISTIEKNFKLNKKRNLWDNISVLHHAYKDKSNSKYHKLNFKALLPIYTKILTAMFNNMKLAGEFEFECQIVNYTCLSNSNYMDSHIHSGTDFTAVHYIQFDKKHHTSTMYENGLPHAQHILQLRPELIKILSKTHNSNSWAYRNWILDVEEDDFVLSPSYLMHRIIPQNSKNKNRITLVLNINLKEKK